MPPPSPADKGIFPAARSRVVIRLAQGRKAKPNANTRTLRPDKCLVVKSLDSSLRPVCPSQHGIHRHHHQGVEGREGRPLLGCQSCFPLSRRGNNQTVPSLALSRRESRQSGGQCHHLGQPRRADISLDYPSHCPSLALVNNADRMSQRTGFQPTEWA